MAAQDICERDSTWDWLDSVKDDLRICAGLIANGAGRWLVGEVADVAKAEKFEAAGYQRAMAEERGTQLAELMVLVLAAYAGDAGRPASMPLITANLVGIQQQWDRKLLEIRR